MLLDRSTQRCTCPQTPPGGLITQAFTPLYPLCLPPGRPQKRSERAAPLRSRAVGDQNNPIESLAEPLAADVRPQSPEEVLSTDVWASKPAWCQPWTILATGSAVIGSAWSVSHSPVWTTVLALPVIAWWGLFLGVMPGQYREYAEQNNHRITEQAGSRKPI